MRILYVEDNQANLFLVQRVARMGGHEVITYTNGEQALENFTRDNPHLILMDVQLSGQLTGLDVVKQLRAAGHRVPIVAVTAYAMVGDRERCLAAGCDAYLSKPLPIAELVEIIRKYDTPVPSQPVSKRDEPAASAEGSAAPGLTTPAEPSAQPAVETIAAPVTNATTNTGSETSVDPVARTPIDKTPDLTPESPPASKTQADAAPPDVPPSPIDPTPATAQPEPNALPPSAPESASASTNANAAPSRK